MPTRRKHRQHRPPPQFAERAAALRNKREIVDRIDTWENCGRWPCFRARACRTPGVACFDEQREAVQACIVDETYANYRLAGISEELLPEADGLL